MSQDIYINVNSTYQHEIKAKSKSYRFATEVRPKWVRSETRSETEVKSKWCRSEAQMNSLSESEARSKRNRCGAQVRSMWYHSDIEVKPMWDRGETEVKPKRIRSETEVKSIWKRSDIDVRTKWNRSEIEVKSARNRCGTEGRPLEVNSETRPEWNRIGIELRSKLYRRELEVNRNWNRSEINMTTKSKWDQAKTKTEHIVQSSRKRNDIDTQLNTWNRESLSPQASLSALKLWSYANNCHWKQTPKSLEPQIQFSWLLASGLASHESCVCDSCAHYGVW